MKEGKYIADYLCQQFVEVIEQHGEYKRLPIFVLSMYGDHKSNTSVIVNPSTNKEILTNWQLPKLTLAIKEAIDKWDLELDIQPEPKQQVDMTPYMAIKEHIKKGQK